MRFKIGQKVVCVNTKNINPYTTVKEGNIYTIIDIVDANDGKGLILDTEENGNEFGFPFFWGYNPKRFEPLKYDIVDNKEIINNIIEEKSDIPLKEHKILF